MIRLYVIVEGQTERVFVHSMLRPRLSNLVLRTALVGKSGGRVKYARAKKDIRNTLKSGEYVTTMLDYYALPRDYPKRAESSRGDPINHATQIEDSMLDDIARELGPSFNRSCFIPYLSVHEWEALLFSDSACMADGFDRDDLAAPLKAIRDQFPTLEHIDDSTETAPSKRIENLFPAYGKNKVRYGPLAAAAVGLAPMRRECAHFAEWLTKLEALTAEA